jgi:hypothetical protein
MNFVNAIRVRSSNCDFTEDKRDCGLKDCKMSCKWDKALIVLVSNSVEGAVGVANGVDCRLEFANFGSKRRLFEELG